MNLVSSLVLVLIAKLGLLGVAIGTVLGMFVRYMFEVVFLSKNVICRPVWKAMKMMITSAGICTLSVLICNFAINYSAIDTYGAWVCYAFITSFVTICIAAIIYFTFYRETTMSILHRVLRRS